VSMSIEPDRSELPRAYRWMSRYGPVLLCIVGAAMVLYAMLADKQDAVSITLIVMGAGSLIVGVLLPRIKGAVEVGTGGVKAALQGVEMIDTVKSIVAATAETVAQETIPDDQADKEAKVAREVELLLRVVTTWLETGAPEALLYSRLRHPSASSVFRDADPKLVGTYLRFVDAVAQFSGRNQSP
jgi:hypothetical protein